MKMILTLAVMMLATTSLYAADKCELGKKCAKEDCVALNSKYAVNADGICVDSAKGESKLSECTTQNASGTPFDGTAGQQGTTPAKQADGNAVGK